MKYHVIVSGEGHDCQLFVGFEGKPEGDASAADIIACLRANPEAAGQVLLALESQYIAGEMAKSQARAERAEHSLAASERALAALRYQVEAGGCELSTVGENFYHCRADTLCGLCRLRHRAEQAERELATLRAKLARCEAVVEAARKWAAGDLQYHGHTGLKHDVLAALRALDADTGGDDPSRAEAATRQVPIGCGVAAVDSAGRVIWWEPGEPLRPTPEAPATRREVEELRREVADLARRLSASEGRSG